MNIIGITGRAGSGKDTLADILVRSHGFVKVSVADPMKRFAKEILSFTDEQLWGLSEMRNAPDKRFPRARHEMRPAGPQGHLDSTKYVCACCGVSQETLMYLDGNPEPQCYLTPRFALQQLGTEWGRAMFEDVWIDHAMRTARSLLFEKPGYYAPWYHPAVGLRQEGAQPWPGGVVIPDVRFPNELARIRAEGGRIWHRSGKGTLAGTTAAAHASESYELDCDKEIVWLDDVADLPWTVAEILKEG